MSSSPTPTPSSPMPARSAEATAAAAQAEPPWALAESMPPKTDPDALLDQIRELITDDFPAARRLAVEGAARFPGHAGLRSAKRILAEGTARVGTGGPAPSRREEFAWLRDPPPAVRGQWVALVGAEMVGAAETLAELAADLEGRTFARVPLVHHID